MTRTTCKRCRRFVSHDHLGSKTPERAYGGKSGSKIPVCDQDSHFLQPVNVSSRTAGENTPRFVTHPSCKRKRGIANESCLNWHHCGSHVNAKRNPDLRTNCSIL